MLKPSTHSAKVYLLCFSLGEVRFDSLAVSDHQVRQKESGFTQKGMLGEVFLLLSVRVVVHTDSDLVVQLQKEGTINTQRREEAKRTARLEKYLLNNFKEVVQGEACGPAWAGRVFDHRLYFEVKMRKTSGATHNDYDEYNLQ